MTQFHFTRIPNISQADFRSNSTPEVSFAYPEPEPEIDWEDAARQAEIRIEVWSRLLGFYTCEIKRQEAIFEHCKFMQRAENLDQKSYSIEYFSKANQE